MRNMDYEFNQNDPIVGIHVSMSTEHTIIGYCFYKRYQLDCDNMASWHLQFSLLVLNLHATMCYGNSLGDYVAHGSPDPTLFCSSQSEAFFIPFPFF